MLIRVIIVGGRLSELSVCASPQPALAQRVPYRSVAEQGGVAWG